MRLVGSAELSPAYYERIRSIKESNHGRYTFDDKDHGHYITDTYYMQMHGDFLITAGHDGRKDMIAINSLMPGNPEYLIITCSKHLAGIESDFTEDSPLLRALPKLADIIKNERDIAHFSNTFQNCYR